MYKLLTILLLPKSYGIKEHRVCGDIYRVIFTDNQGSYLRVFDSYKESYKFLKMLKYLEIL